MPHLIRTLWELREAKPALFGAIIALGISAVTVMANMPAWCTPDWRFEADGIGYVCSAVVRTSVIDPLGLKTAPVHPLVINNYTWLTFVTISLVGAGVGLLLMKLAGERSE